MKTKRLIYSLCCPFTKEIHYIGKTIQGMIRPLEHTKESHSKKINEWVNNLKELNHSPEVKILEYVSIDDDLDAREKYWIQLKLNEGCILLNDILVSPLLINPGLDKILGEDLNGLEVYRLGNFIKQRRKKTGLTQEDFAHKTGIALKVLRKIEQGKTNFQFDGLLQILKMFGCTVDVVKL